MRLGIDNVQKSDSNSMYKQITEKNSYTFKKCVNIIILLKSFKYIKV